MTGRTYAQNQMMQINMGMAMVMSMSMMRGKKCAEMLPAEVPCSDCL